MTFARVLACACIVFLAAGATCDRDRSRGTDWRIAVFPSGAQFTLELARTDRERARGYMYREEVGPHEGMLFVFEEPGRHGMWMMNCKVPLDIVWLDESFRVVDIAPNLPPCAGDEPCGTTVPDRNASYVLEVAGGRVEAEGLRRGDAIVLLSDGASP